MEQFTFSKVSGIYSTLNEDFHSFIHSVKPTLHYQISLMKMII